MKEEISQVISLKVAVFYVKMKLVGDVELWLQVFWKRYKVNTPRLVNAINFLAT